MVAHQAEGGVLDQRAAFGGQGEKVAVIKQRRVLAQAQYPGFLVAIKRFRARQQFALAGGAIVDALDQPSILDRTHGIGGDGGEREMLGQLDAGAGDFQ